MKYSNHQKNSGVLISP